MLLLMEYKRMIQSSVGSTSTAVFERLEQRNLLSATLEGSELRVVGTHSSDLISVIHRFAFGTKRS
jgi:hypothetical protein